MNDEERGAMTFGLDMETMVADAWRIFIGRPFTLIGIGSLVAVLGIVTHLFVLLPFFWAPFTLCVPYAVVLIKTGEKTDRIFMGWIHRYPRLLAVFLPAVIAFIILATLCAPEFSVMGTNDSDEGRQYLALLLPVLLEKILIFTLGLPALLAVRRNLSPTEALVEVFRSRRFALESFLLGGTLALLSMSGVLICCVGTLATTTFAWICLGVAYHQMFEA